MNDMTSILVKWLSAKGWKNVQFDGTWFTADGGRYISLYNAQHEFKHV